VVFPSLKARALLGVLCREPLAYEVSRQKGSHRVLDSRNGYPRLGFSFHDRATVPPGVVRKILVRDVGLGETEALKMIEGKADKGEA
jgi:predicted RNA binding protein YcfA (HicA-like mRNA interferase family)